MQYLSRFYIVLAVSLLLAGCGKDAAVSSNNEAPSDDLSAFPKEGVQVSHTQLVVFQPAGDFGGGVLVPGTVFPPGQTNRSTMLRGENWIGYLMETSGLPPGAYTNWWVIINNPENCTDGVCDEEDVFSNPATNSSAFWATGGVVEANGEGNFRARVEIGEIPEEPGQFIFGPGLLNPMTAEVHLIVKYHGPASSDPEVLYLQTHTLTGSCQEGANAYDLTDEGFGIQCFDPQVAINKP